MRANDEAWCEAAARLELAVPFAANRSLALPGLARLIYWRTVEAVPHQRV
jgi:hypothetical protein